MTDDESLEIMMRAIAFATEIKESICVCVVDTGGLLNGFLRMRDAIPGAIDVSIKKARTASLFRMDSESIGKIIHRDGVNYTLSLTNGGLIGFGGGVVIYDDAAKVIGAVGVSGATAEIDNAIALAAAGRQ
jgi:uncharacterized protein GlcG (DUF336 family)